MALINKLDQETTLAALQRWLPGKIDGASDVEISDLEIPHSSGMSMTTVLFTAQWTADAKQARAELVARVEPTGTSLFEHPDLEREYALLTPLSRETDLPIPTTRWLETDTSILGARFMVMDRVRGQVPADDPPFVTEGWVVDLQPAQREALFDNALQVLAELQALDHEKLGLEFLSDDRFGPTGARQQIGWWRRMYEWTADGALSPTLDAAFAWADDHCPADDTLALNWGDCRLGNIMYADDQSIAAVLDWEMATIASPQNDLGWFVLFLRYYSEGIGVAPLEGTPSRAQAIARWEQLTGRTAGDIDYYETFAAIRLAVILMRLGSLMIEAGALPPDNPMPISNPASQMLARMLDLPAPEGASTNFVGNRQQRP